MHLILFFTFPAIILWLLVKWGSRHQNFFADRGVKFLKPLPFVGNSLRFFINRENIFDHIVKLCAHFPNERIFGSFEGMSPILVIRDPDLVKQLAVKGSDHFTDHRLIVSRDVEPLFAHSLFALTGQKWKEMRATLSPAFTGSKMRLMCDFIIEICEQMVDFLTTEAQEKGPQVHEVKDLFTKLTTDIIGICAFGIKVDSLKDSKNQFYVNAREMFNPASIILFIKFIALRAFPSVMQFFGITIFGKRNRRFMKNLALNNMKTRIEKNIFRPDMIHLLIEARKGTLESKNFDKENDSAGFATVEEVQTSQVFKKTSWTDDEIVGQCFIFFLAGFDTSSTALSFVAFELAANTDIQDKLYQEALATSKELNGKPLKYEQLQKMKYLDMVVSETLRLWPPQASLDRMCTKKFTMEYDIGKKYTFLPGDLFWIPVGDFHFNPDFFPEPKKFDPERFSDENKGSINPSTYAPFGIGPRSCIASRFALMKLKSIIYYLILNFHFDLSTKTQVPLKLAGSVVGMKVSGGIWIKFRPRSATDTGNI